MSGSLTTTNQSNAVTKTSSTNTAEQLGATAPILQGLMEGQGLHNPAPAIEARNQQAALTAGQLVRAREIYHAAPTLANRDLLIATLRKELTTQRLQFKDAQAQLKKYQAEKEREAQIQQGRQGWGEWAINSLKNFFGSATDPQLEKYQRVVIDAQKEIAELEAEQNNLTGTLAKNWIDNLPIFETQVIAPQNAEAIAALPQPHSRQLLQSNMPSSPEFRVNTYTAYDQWYPRVAALSTGDFVVAWTSGGQDGSGDGVYGQRYSANGTALGTEFRVNTYTAGGQGNPSVAALSTADFVVAWQSYGQDGDSGGVYAQRYSANGTALGTEFRVNSYTVGNQVSPSVVALSTGDFVVAWQSYGQDGDSGGVYAQRYNATGVAQGSEFRVNTYTVNYQDSPSVAVLSTGDFVVAWASYGQDGSSNGVYAQRYNATGAAHGGEFRVNTYTTYDQWYPSVAALSTGDFVVAWQSYGQDGDSYGVYAQRYNATGVAQGSEFQVNTYTVNYQYSPSVAALSTGDFVVAWASYGQDGSSNGVYARRYNATGVAQGSEFRVNSYTAANQDSPSVAVLSTGDFVVAWQSFGQDGDDGWGVYVRICFEDNCRPPSHSPQPINLPLIAFIVSTAGGLAMLCFAWLLYTKYRHRPLPVLDRNLESKATPRIELTSIPVTVIASEIVHPPTSLSLPVTRREVTMNPGASLPPTTHRFTGVENLSPPVSHNSSSAGIIRSLGSEEKKLLSNNQRPALQNRVPVEDMKDLSQLSTPAISSVAYPVVSQGARGEGEVPDETPEYSSHLQPN